MIVKTLIDVVLHLDKHLGNVIQVYGTTTYFLLFAVVFLETGLVVTPFLPGDSLIFAAGAFAAIGSLDIYVLYIVFLAAAVLGDTLNYHIGKEIGYRIYEKENVRFIKKEYLMQARMFYEKYGAITIVLARFIPIIRTFAPFVAGIGEMNYIRFLSYNVVGGISWTALFTFGGYFFGNLKVVKENFGFVIIAIIIISLLPAIIGFLKQKIKA
ncbi:VTT domain-containing protein [Caldanaerobius polysaccharolyticus]|uniref:VTT domain-containing protein n=1 Tax=Caldanaerobius polysaccharolyticus TaxID=44256 RepID=UPI00047C0439|nr:VTT domain-containing protein [Caldanaerobius polysaccharolyticus]